MKNNTVNLDKNEFVNIFLNSYKKKLIILDNVSTTYRKDSLNLLLSEILFIFEEDGQPISEARQIVPTTSKGLSSDEENQ